MHFYFLLLPEHDISCMPPGTASLRRTQTGLMREREESKGGEREREREREGKREGGKM